ncbi:hypothetical protein K503DRAFT_784799 [Rhizopogon vinicolor AM-OR11-026]|uniref:Uncharacterized protein n=1 Tax=Rhizopogon vinicolor AM-OR11-026 TaxID=1314800 RepID=A0A1B7MTA3_9AGAM|nr:hypothetical protein K503DRAFT_784799 [Rhizopogon vinicolor AM-OR11-026]
MGVLTVHCLLLLPGLWNIERVNAITLPTFEGYVTPWITDERIVGDMIWFMHFDDTVRHQQNSCGETLVMLPIEFIVIRVSLISIGIIINFHLVKGIKNNTMVRMLEWLGRYCGDR